MIELYSVFLYFIFSCLIILYFWSIGRRKYKAPPMYPGALPIIGHSLQFMMHGRDPWSFLKGLMLFAFKNGDEICSVLLGKYTLHILANPDDCYKVANICFNKHDMYSLVKSWLGDGLLISPEPIWKVHRKLLNSAFNQQILNGYLKVFNKESRKLANIWKEKTSKGQFDHLPYVANWSLVNICSTAMDYNEEENSENLLEEYKALVPALQDCVLERIRKIWYHNEYIFQCSNLKKRQDKILANINNLGDKIMQQKKAEMQTETNDVSQETQKKYKSYLYLLLDLNQRNILTNKAVKDEIANIIVAGYDTSLISLTVILVVLGSHPNIQDKVFLELQSVFNGEDRDVTKEDLSLLKYLEAVIKESLRLYPVVPIILRNIDKDIQIRNYTLPAGEDIVIPIYALNRHSVWGPDADVFRPERWLDSSSLPENSHSYAAFSMGRRNCIGINYAIISLKTALAHILRSYKITADIKKVKYDLRLTLMPVSGHHIEIEKR